MRKQPVKKPPEDLQIRQRDIDSGRLVLRKRGAGGAVLSKENEKDAMMSSSIKTIKSLPDWFNLDNYKEAEKLDALGWLEQLKCRASLRLRLRSDRFNDHINELYFKKVLSSYRSAPIIDPIKCDPKKNIFNIYDCLKSLPIVHQTTLFEHFNANSKIEPEIQKIGSLLYEIISPKNIKYLMKNPSDDENFGAEEQEFRNKQRELDDLKDKLDQFEESLDNFIKAPFMSSPGPKGSRVKADKPVLRRITVDLSFPDQQIIQSLSVLLKKLRSESFYAQALSKPTIRNPKFDDWIRLGVLPFIDLHLWELENKKNIPNRVMADAIFQDGEGGEETIRKTTSKIAKKILDREFLLILAGMTADEIAE
jgi:Family of unknown function (DUF6387)